MKSKKLKTLFVVLAAAMTITGVNYAGGYNLDTAYAAESADTVSESQDADSAVTDVQNKVGKVDIKVSYNNETSTNSIDPVITVTNNSDEEMNLSDLNLKYYYPSNTEINEVFACYYAGTVDGDYRSLTANVEGTLEKCETVKGEADKYADLTFNGGTLDAGQSMTIQISIHKEDWTNYDVTDKSLCCINGYLDGTLVYGEDKKPEQGEEEKPNSGEGEKPDSGDGDKPGTGDADKPEIGEEVQDSELSEHEAVFSAESDPYIEIHVKLNGNKFLGIDVMDIDGEKKQITLTEGKDYTIKYDESKEDYMVIINPNFFAETDGDNKFRELRFNFSAGKPQDFYVSEMCVMMPWGQMMGISNAEGKYDDILEVPAYINKDNDIVNFNTCAVEFRYSPDKVKLVDVKPGKAVGENDGFEYTVDAEKGTVSVTCKKKLNIIVSDESDIAEDLELCKLYFQNINGIEGTECDIRGGGEIRGINRYDGQFAKTNIYGITGRIKFNAFNPYENLVMPKVQKNVTYEGHTGKDLEVKIDLNGNEFEGIDGLEEGTDYVFENDTLTLKNQMLEKYMGDQDDYDFYLDFNNEIKEILTINNDIAVIPEYFRVGIGGSDAERNSLIMVPIDIRNNVGDILTQCDFDLKYDTDIFEDAYIVCDDENVQSEADIKTGVVKVTYDKHDSTLSGECFNENVRRVQLKMNLVLKVRADAPFGDTKVTFNNNKFIARNTMAYDAHASRGIIKINK